MQKYRIFYSWQSDLENRLNRNLIQDALEKAVKSIKSDVSINVEAVVDRDTDGVSGTPDIVATIFEKIDASEIFICDVSIVNSEQGGRKTPNPNVLIELGYAAKSLGWERVILVMNTAVGKPEDLPFDLRMRRVIQYKFNLEEGEKSEVKIALSNTIKLAISSIVTGGFKKPPIYELKRIEHDTSIFEKAEQILSESSFLNFLNNLEMNGFYNDSIIKPLDNFWKFFLESTNSFITPILIESVWAFLKKLNELNLFLSKNSYRKPPLLSTHDSGFFVLPNPPVKPEDWDTIEKVSKNNINQNQLLKYCLELRQSYRNYRLSVKQNLYL